MVQRTLGGVTSLRGTIVPLRRATHKIQMPRASITARATQTNTNTSGISYQALNDAGGVYLVSSQEEVRVGDLWRPDQRCVFALGRSMG